MNKKITQRFFAALAVALFFVGGAIAQVADNNYVEGGAAAVAAEVVDTVTVSTRTGLYAEPDGVFHPNYNVGNGWALTAGFTWSWTTNGGTAVGSGSETHTAPPANYIEIDWGGIAGTYTQSVQEVAPAAYGGCSGSTVNMDVEVINAPTVTLSNDDNQGDGSGVIGPDAASLVFCEGDNHLQDMVEATFTHGMSGSPSFSLQYVYDVDTLDYAGGNSGNVAADSASYTVAAGSEITGLDVTAYDLVKPTNPLACVTNGGGEKKITTYTYTLYSVNDRISRKGDYLAMTYAGASDYTWYTATATATISIVVNPAPVTGPIYHISNTFAD
jgi:hypothetical protein